MASFGLYSHIQANRWRSVFLLIGLFLLVFLMVFAGALVAEAFFYSYKQLTVMLRDAWRNTLIAAPYAAIGTCLWVVIAYRYHQTLIDAVTGGHEVAREEQPKLYNLLENLCISRGIVTPKLKLIESDALNAFATGLNSKQYSISVTTGLLKNLSEAELEAVLAHELTHIRNGDVRMMVIAGVIAGIVSFVAELFFRMVSRSSGGSGRSSSSSSGSSGSSSSSDKKGGGGAFGAVLIAVALIALAWFLSVVIRYALSRSREFLADAGSAELTKNPDAMISALRKIEGRGELPGVTSAVMELCVDNPRSGIADLFATHPSIDARAAALVEFAGGRDPGPMVLPGTDDKLALPPAEAAPPESAQDELPPPGSETRYTQAPPG